MVERGCDLTLGCLLLLLAGPLIAVCAAAVWVSMGRPIFFCQIRIGRNGIPFKLYKLRSMTASRYKHAFVSAIEYYRHSLGQGNPRVTHLGRWLRRFYLDELPQLWNVVLGHMSIVGPRPLESVELAERYSRPLLQLRITARPGLVGLEQVASSLGMPRAREVELQYAEQHDLRAYLKWLSLSILAIIHGPARDQSPPTAPEHAQHEDRHRHSHQGPT